MKVSKHFRLIWTQVEEEFYEAPVQTDPCERCILGKWISCLDMIHAAAPEFAHVMNIVHISGFNKSNHSAKLYV